MFWVVDAECHVIHCYAVYLYAECYCAECHYAEWRGAKNTACVQDGENKIKIRWKDRSKSLGETVEREKDLEMRRGSVIYKEGYTQHNNERHYTKSLSITTLTKTI